MGKHRDESKPTETNPSDYDAKHKGAWDGFDWAEYSAAEAETQKLPVVKKSKEKW